MRQIKASSRRQHALSGIVAFDVPAGKYLVLGIGDQPVSIAAEPGYTNKLKLVVH